MQMAVRVNILCNLKEELGECAVMAMLSELSSVFLMLNDCYISLRNVIHVYLLELKLS